MYMCLYATLIKNRKYIANKKNGGNPPIPTDERVKYVAIGCQQCIECRKQKARGWQVRLLEDLKAHRNGKFVTFTFSNESIQKLHQYITEQYQDAGITPPEGYELDNVIATAATRLFLERWRKKHKRSLRHWLVTELGGNGTENIHLHGIIWTNEPLTEVEKTWQYGFMWKGQEINGRIINYVNERTVNYIIKYVHKIDEKHRFYNSKILTSPGIGANYTTSIDSRNNKFQGKKTNETYRTRTGHTIAMPIYWRNKIYNDQEREKLWLQRLDKQERWICGERVDISKNEIQYYKLLEWHRKRAATLGYGNNELTWDREEYERQRRKLLQDKRLAKSQNNTKNKSVKPNQFEKIDQEILTIECQNNTTIIINNRTWWVTDQGLTSEQPYETQ